MNKLNFRKIIFIFTLPFYGLAIGEIISGKIVIKIVLVILVGLVSNLIMPKDEKDST